LISFIYLHFFFFKFNPLLNETFECDRLDDYGWRSVAEQVSHHPPGVAVHVESLKDWVFYQEFTMSSKFRGQYLQIIPLGTSHLEFKKTGFHYTWRKVATFVRNIIVGKLWIDNVGEMDIVNHKTKDVCHLKYFPYSYFSRDPPKKVTGIITDSNNVARYVLNGTWTEKMEGAPVLNPQVVTEQTQLNTGKSKVLWERRYPS
jgi:oxysterol-binding protein 1